MKDLTAATTENLAGSFQAASAEIWIAEVYRGDTEDTLQEYSRRITEMHHVEVELRRRGLDALATLLRAEHDQTLAHGSIGKRMREMIDGLVSAETLREEYPHVSPPPSAPPA